MSIETLVITLTLLLICGLWIGAPLLRSARRLNGNEALQRDRLLTTYDRLLTNIRDLDEDFATGKIQPDAYQTDRETLIQKGIETLIALDGLMPVRSEASLKTSVDRSIEDAVAAYRRKART